MRCVGWGCEVGIKMGREQKRRMTMTVLRWNGHDMNDGMDCGKQTRKNKRKDHVKRHPRLLSPKKIMRKCHGKKSPKKIMTCLLFRF